MTPFAERGTTIRGGVSGCYQNVIVNKNGNIAAQEMSWYEKFKFTPTVILAEIGAK